jgi:ATP-dependent helicase/nuclease subunit B
MLKIMQIQNPSQIEELLSSFDPQKQSWVVSDLRTKLEMQKVLIDRQGFFLESAVLRASDLWKILLKRLAPEIRIVSKDFAKSLLRTFINENAEAFGINATSEKSLFNYMIQLAPLALAGEGDEQISKWFADHGEISLRWQSWYLIARTALRWMIDDKKIIIADWIPSYLQEVDALETSWDQEIIVDLGSEISNVEAEVFQRLSQSVDVTIIEPKPAWSDEFAYLLKPYEFLRSHTRQVEKRSVEIPARTPGQVLRLSGMLAEVKMACAQARRWLESGIKPSSVAIIAPDIEQYWPVLSSFLEQEGIPVQKEQTVKLQSLPSLHQWMASLRSQTSKLNSADLEASFYGSHESQGLRYEEFISLFKAIYGEEDLGRHRKVHQLYGQNISLDAPLQRDQFLAQALKAWSRKDSQTELLIQVLREIFQNAGAKIEMSYREWLTYLENILVAKELRVSPAASEGIVVTPLMSAQSYKMSHKIFLGLSEESLKDRQRSHILGSDLNRLALDLGFYLEHPDHSYKEFQLRWLSESPGSQNIFSFGLADFSGSLLSPSNFWMGLHPSEEISLPADTRWDQLQGASEHHVLRLRGRSESEETRLRERIEIDLGMKLLPTLTLATTPSLSASQLEKYLKCPFIFAAQKIFKLQDHPGLDLDEDPRSKGTFAHALFEVLTFPEFRSDVDDQTLNQILEDLKERQDLTLADPRLWASMKRRYFKLARRFLNFESQWRQAYPDTHTIAAEKYFEFYFNPQSGEIQREATAGTLKFSGKIDRIDQHRGQKNFVVIDYKSSAAAYKNHASWFENIELQLLFYMWALEKEMLAEIAGDVVGAFYYSFKDFSRGKGLQIEDHAGPLFPPAGRRGVKATADDKSDLLAKFEVLILDVVGQIQRGEFAPRPFDPKICQTCEWNVLCRAPHLN